MNAPTESHISLAVPAATASLRYVRVVAATVADDAGFDVARIESLRLAVDELCALVIDVATDGATLSLEFTVVDAGVDMRGVCSPVAGEPLVDPIAERVLSTVKAEHHVEVDGDTCTVTLHCPA